MGKTFILNRFFSGRSSQSESKEALINIGPEPERQTENKPSSINAWAEKQEAAEVVAYQNLDVPQPKNASKTGLCLAADVGGTNSRFMLYTVDIDEQVHLRQEAPGKLLLVRKYANICYGCFADVVQAFFDDAHTASVISDGVHPEVACLAVAGVAQQNIARLTNLDWIINGPELSARFEIGIVEVINDFVAQGYGVLTLSEDEVIQLSGPEPVMGAPIACVGAGTGLGQCFLTAGSTGEYQAYPSEGGHAEFAPRGAGNDETQIELLRHLKVKFSGWNRISYERVVSGKGICNVYEFLAYSRPMSIDLQVHKEFLHNQQDAGIIAKNAAPGNLCHEALKIFASCYGAVSGTFALQVMPFGGLYLSGGVTQKLQSFLREEGSFMEAYMDKGRVSPMLKDVPLFFVKGDEMGQRGAHLRAVRLLHRNRKGLLVPESGDASKVHLAPPRNAQLKELLQDSVSKVVSMGLLSPSNTAPASTTPCAEDGVNFTPVAPILASE
mmetsp:Transcript_129262/g.249322  ORF Transcript_129262/g.249322 Transcript_129262/m.249322 type:complete len:498 (-) Transcript_129262:282-1775(-)